METQKLITHFILLFLLPLLFISCSSAFTTIDNYLISCGSQNNASIFNRIFISDSTSQGSIFLSADKSISLTNQNLPPQSPTLFHTARVFPQHWELQVQHEDEMVPTLFVFISHLLRLKGLI
ncbi:hypothetical protein GLYMA_09G133000v4 [Glycine max]|nr:hypothetical protein GLYMA_09G133000v4 [Glycine max]